MTLQCTSAPRVNTHNLGLTTGAAADENRVATTELCCGNHIIISHHRHFGTLAHTCACVRMCIMCMQADLRERGWRDPQGLKAFTRNSSSPDLWIYFVAADRTSPVNVAATKVRASCDGACSLSARLARLLV